LIIYLQFKDGNYLDTRGRYYHQIICHIDVDM